MFSCGKRSKLTPDAGLHALRHTFLTEAGEYTAPFTLQYVAGHDNIKPRCATCTHAKKWLRNRVYGSRI